MKNKLEMLVVISYFHKRKDKLKLKKSRYKKSSRKVKYYSNSNSNESLIKSIPIENCTLKDIEEVLLKVYPNEKHIEKDKYGNEYIFGGYDITPQIKELLFERLNIEIDIKQFNCQLEEVYETDI